MNKIIFQGNTYSRNKCKEYLGGAIFINNTSNVMFQNETIESNRSYQMGGNKFSLGGRGG